MSYRYAKEINADHATALLVGTSLTGPRLALAADLSGTGMMTVEIDEGLAVRYVASTDRFLLLLTEEARAVLAAASTEVTP